MKNMDKGLTVPKWLLPNLSAQSQKFWILRKKSFIGDPKSVDSTYDVINKQKTQL